MNYNCIVVLGPTASGKTRAACLLADHLSGEVISADSRQVYSGLDIGTGKDLQEYIVNGRHIPYHLINIRPVNDQYYVHEFIHDLHETFLAISARGRVPIICGGTGLYLDVLRKDLSLTQVKENSILREELSALSKTELLQKLDTYPQEYTAHTDRSSVKRITRAIETADARANGLLIHMHTPKDYRPYYIGIHVSAEERKENITKRLVQRLEEGLLEEVRGLLQKGVAVQRLHALGLEYKYCALHLTGELSYDDFFSRLQTAIFQYSKRQMTWFRKMEKEGVKIKWVNGPEVANLVIELRALLVSGAG
jgi:tRNA dimethylallyltransferase